MDTNLLTISNLITPVESVPVTSSNTRVSKQTSSSSVVSNNDTCNGKTNKTDNAFRQIHDKAIEKQSGDCEQSVDQTQPATQNTETQDNTKPKAQQTNTEESNPTNSTQSLQNDNANVVTVTPQQQTNEQTLVEQTLLNEISNTTASLQSGETPVADTRIIEPTVIESTEAVNIIPETDSKPISTQADQILSRPENLKTDVSVNPLDELISQKAGESTIENQPKQNKTENTEQKIVSNNNQKQFVEQIDPDNKQTKTDTPVTNTTQATSLTSETKPALESVAVSNTEISATDVKAPDITTKAQTVQTESNQPQIQQTDTDGNKSGQSTEKQRDENTDNLKTFSQISGNSNKETINVGNDTSGDPDTKKLNITDVQISADEPKDIGNSSTDGNSNTATEQILNSSTTQNTATEQSLNSTYSTKNAEPILQNQQTESYTDVGKQILESIHSSVSRQGTDQEITVRLNPPELGNVIIKFQEQDNQVTGLLEVSKSQTRFEIEQALPQIVRDLADSGIQVKRLEVVLSNQQNLGQETLREQLMQNGGSQNQNSNDSPSWQNGPDRGQINDFLVNDVNYRYKSGTQDTFAGSGSINMLM